MSDSTYAVPPPPAERVRRPSYLLWGCALILILGVLLIGSCTAFLLQRNVHGRFGKRVLDPYTERFFAAWDGEDYEGLRAMVAGAPGEGQSPDTIIDMVRDLRAQLGPVQERSFRGFNINTSTEGGFADASYHVRFANGEGDVNLSFVDEDDVWMLSAVEITSDSSAPQPAEDPSTVQI